MSRIRSRDSVPELTVRRFVHANGLRYRLHARGLSGKPDLVFASRRACVFVHGCFWHGCPNCIDGTRHVKSNQSYWLPKVAGNRARDERHRAALAAAGWTVFVIWECEVKNDARLITLIEQLKAIPVKRKNERGEGREGSVQQERTTSKTNSLKPSGT